MQGMNLTGQAQEDCEIEALAAFWYFQES
jgi:hypothetical protein